MEYPPTNDVEVVWAAVGIPVLFGASAEVPSCPPICIVSLGKLVLEGAVPDPSRDKAAVVADPEASLDTAPVSSVPESGVSVLADVRSDVGDGADMAADTLASAADALDMATDALDSAAAALDKAAGAPLVAGESAPLACTVAVVVVSEVMVVTDAASGYGYGFGIAWRLRIPCSSASAVGLLDGVEERVSDSVADSSIGVEVTGLMFVSVGATAAPVSPAVSPLDDPESAPAG
ncbi:hypothetical protein C8T65DRAFT_26686 [Cerioporus squamosus]|nr:hypothetical protein C8T65DRAFT_26686 [Cerioporus squamosus]